jgi:hypothetical protein
MLNIPELTGFGIAERIRIIFKSIKDSRMIIILLISELDGILTDSGTGWN